MIDGASPATGEVGVVLAGGEGGVGAADGAGAGAGAGRGLAAEDNLGMAWVAPAIPARAARSEGTVKTSPV
jgi:hypothetical protein